MILIQCQILKKENKKLSKISIIIPTYNESQNLPLLLSDLSEINHKGEIIIVDSDSNDKTEEISFIYGAKYFGTKKNNRGFQLNYGAKKANGDWFFFLHADSRIKKDWLKKMDSVFKKDKKYIYYFKFEINDKKIIYRFLEILVNLRCKLFKSPYGDQGLLIHRETYKKNNGFKELPLMEDLDFIQRLNNEDLKQIKTSILTSSRKWEKTNIIFQSIRNWKFRQRWYKGEPISILYQEYYKNRAN